MASRVTTAVRSVGDFYALSVDSLAGIITGCARVAAAPTTPAPTAAAAVPSRRRRVTTGPRVPPTLLAIDASTPI